MSSEKKNGIEIDELRRRAEEIDRENIRQTPEIMDVLSPEAAWQLIRELRVNQIELELKNEELRQAQAQRKQVENALRESELKYRQLFEMEADALFLIDSQTGNLLDVNLAAVALYGYSRDELLNMRHVGLSAEPDETVKAASNAGKSGKVVIPIRYHRKKDGTVFPVEINSTSLIWKGRPALMPSIRDITEQKQTEDALRESERRLREVLENSLDAAYKRNLQTNSYDYLSPVFTQISGYSAEAMKKLPIEAVLNLMHPDDQAEVERVITDSISGIIGTEYHLEYRFKHKAGQYRWFQDKFIIVRDADGKPSARIGSVSDITDRKRAEEKLQNIIDGTNVGTWEWNVQTGETVFNERWAEIAGYTLAELQPVSIETWMRCF